MIENRSAKEAPHLLFLYRIARHGKHVAAAGENGSRDPSLQRGKESQSSFFQGDHRIAAAKRNAILGDQVINLGRIDRQCVDRIVQFMG